MFLEERHKKIYEILKEKKRAEVSTLSEIFELSADTIRRDLNTMEKKGIIKKTHGGAILSEKTGFVPDYKMRTTRHSETKLRISEYALKFIDENDTLFLLSSTTVESLASLLGKFEKLTIFTNSIRIAESALSCSNNLKVNILGGSVKASSLTVSGASSLAQLENIRVDKVFIGACSISSSWGISTPVLDEVDFNRKLIDIGREIFILTDSEKLETQSTYKICDLDGNFTIITNEGPDSEKISNFNDAVSSGLKFISC